MAILHLVLKKKWFDRIAAGLKPAEFREFTPYWRARLMRDGAIRQDFTEVHFRNGYSTKAPFMRWTMGSITVYRRDFIVPLNGEQLTADRYFMISLGKMLELRR